MSAYDNDLRVQPHSDGTWMVFPDGGGELNVAPLRDRDTWELIPGLFGAFDSHGHRVAGVAEGPFDHVVYALIGDPR